MAVNTKPPIGKKQLSRWAELFPEDNLLATLSNPKDKEDEKYCKLIKDLRIRFVFTVVTTDKDIFTVSVSNKDLK